MKIKTAEATPLQIDWLVAKIEGATPQQWAWYVEYNEHRDEDQKSRCYAYSTNWAQGGPIIEREKIAIEILSFDNQWSAHYKHPAFTHPNRMRGPTPLIAAMRCFVASKLGDEVEVPEELT